MDDLVHTNEDAKFTAAANEIAAAALKNVTDRPATMDDWTINNYTDLADYLLTGQYGDECERVAKGLDLDVYELTDAVRELIELGYDPDIHSN